MKNILRIALLIGASSMAFAQNITIQKAPSTNILTAASSPLVVGNGQNLTIASGGVMTFASGSTVNFSAGIIPWSAVDKTGSSLADLATRSATDLTSGTLPDARFPATLPAASGINLTALNASNLGSGTVPNARFPSTLPALDGSALTNLNGTAIATGTVADARLASALTGKTYNGLTLTANATGFSVAGGTTPKTFTLLNSLTFSGTDASTLNIGAGGTLGTAAFTASTAYATAAQGTKADNVGAVNGIVKSNGTATFSAATAGTDYSGGTAALTTGLLKSTTATGALSIAVPSTDYAPATSGTAILYGNGAGGFSPVTVSTGLSFTGGTLTATGGGSVNISGTPVAGQSAEWTNANTIQGVSTTGTGNYAKATSPTFVTPTLGAALATSINGNTFTTGTYTLTGTAAKTLNFTNSLTLSGTDGTTMTFPSTSATLARTDAANTFTGTQTVGALVATTVNGNTLTTGTYTLTGVAAKTLTFNNSLTLAGTDATVMTFPTTSATLARTDAANTFTGTQTIGALIATTLNGNTFTTGTYTLTGTAAKTLNFTNSLTLSGTDATTMTFPGATTTVAGLGTTQTFTGINTFTPTARSSGVAPYLTINTPADTGQTAATESIGVSSPTATRTWATTGTVALQREFFFAGKTYASASASQTFTDAFTFYLTPPIAGTNAIFTRGHTLGIVDATSAASSVTGGLVVSTTLGTTATSVGIGGGNVNAGGNITAGGTLTSVGTFTPSQTNGIVGTTTNNNANAGSVGEYVTATQSFNTTPVSLTTTTPANITSISLTAGDWDVSGVIVYTAAGTTTSSLLASSVSATSATLAAIDSGQTTYNSVTYAAGAFVYKSEVTPIARISIASTTTVYLVGRADFAVSTMVAGGTIRARRIR